MHFNILTLFPEMFPNVLGQSLAGKALQNRLWTYAAVNLRDFAQDKHKTVDDTPYGGGAGMVMKPDILASALDYVIEKERGQRPGTRGQKEKNAERSGSNTSLTPDPLPLTPKLIYPSPRGALLTQSKIEQFVAAKSLTILCGRYEGVDHRVLERYGIEEVSIGDYILSGGEVAAIVIIDACIRKIDGVVSNPQTHLEESFSEGRFRNLLEYPHYTRPEVWEGFEVPTVLKSGNHALIEKWRLEQAEKVTKERRPDLWEKYLKSKR